MKLKLVLIVLVMAISVYEYTYGHEISQPHMFKWENGFMVAWNPVSSDTSKGQISISDGRGLELTQLNVLKAVEDAKRVTIYDVSVNANLIAVGAVYQSNKADKQVRPTAALLLFDLRGELLSAFVLAPSYAISRLVVDDRSHIWTITDEADVGVNPSTVPMVVEYTVEGKIVREVFSRDKFPFHASDTKSDLVMGSPVMGATQGVVWFWLPGSTDLVTISTVDGKAVMTKTQLPSRQGRTEVVLGIAREPSGNVVGQFREDDAKLTPAVIPEVAHYVWSPVTGVWSQFKPSACMPARLVGASDGGPVYMRYEADGSFRTDSLCTAAVQ